MRKNSRCFDKYVQRVQIQMEKRGGEKSGIWGRVRKGFPEERNIEQNPLEA